MTHFSPAHVSKKIFATSAQTDIAGERHLNNGAPFTPMLALHFVLILNVPHHR
jgi:hypothetical protein